VPHGAHGALSPSPFLLLDEETVEKSTGIAWHVGPEGPNATLLCGVENPVWMSLQGPSLHSNSTALFGGRRKVGCAYRGLGSFGMEVFTESRQAHRLLPDSVTPDLVPYIQNMEYIPIFRTIFFEYILPATRPENSGQCSEFSRIELSELNHWESSSLFISPHPRLTRILVQFVPPT
jgi:hypothetical protein